MRERNRVLLLIWLLQFVNYLDRVNISVAAPSMMKALSIDTASFGWVFAAFTIGYATMQIPGGILTDRFGAKLVLVGAPILWSVFTGFTGLLDTAVQLMCVRFLFGLAEGSSNAACYKLVGDHFSPQERASANSVWITALALGPAAVAPLAAMALRSVGWEKMFLFFSIPGFLLAYILFRYLPKRSAATTDETSSHGTGWIKLLAYRKSWLLFGAYLTFNIGFWGFLGWMPGYLSIQRHLDVKTLGVVASVPYVAGFVGILVMGWLGSHTFYRARGVLVACSYLFAAASLFVSYNATDVYTCIVGLSAAAFFMYGGFGPYASLVLDVAPRKERASFVGFVNTGGQIGGAIAPVVIGFVVKLTASFDRGFDFMIGALITSAILYLFLQFELNPGRNDVIATEPHVP
jgi:MFS transporter, ACS family, D-galactonate transporter